MSHTISEPTFTGYISSTHDALIIFECVRRGIMPKVSRRLRDDERKLIRSGSVFVFDERESGIKRWTDGLLWSPSRILWNFLVYRQIEKRSGKGTDASRQSSGPLTTPGEMTIDPLAHGVSYNPGTSSGPSSVATSPAGGTFADMRDFGNSRGRSVSSASDSAAGWRNASYVDPRYSHQHSQLMTSSLSPMTGGNFSAAVPSASGATTTLMDRKEVDLERALVGSLKSSYPFAKDGLCKKTISIQVQGSTQHLISYYKVDDVRSGRLRTPVSLPELSHLNISPILLNKSNFRNPPDIEFLPDGSVRYRGDGSEASRRNTGTGSGSDGTSGSEGRSHHGTAYSYGVPLSPTSSDVFFPPIPASITGYDSRLSGFQNASGGFVPRRLSGTLNRSGRVTSGRYEPYALPPSHGHRGDVALRSGNFLNEQIAPASDASSSAWINGHNSLSRPLEGHATPANRQPWTSAINTMNDNQQYLRDNAAGTGHWPARSDDPILPNWSAHSGTVKPETGTDTGFPHRQVESPRYRESSDNWSQSQLPLLSGQHGQILEEGHGGDQTSRGTSHSAARPYGSSSTEPVVSSADSFPALSSQILSDFSANRNSSSLMTASEGHVSSVSNSKMHQINQPHHSQQLPQQTQQQHLSAYAHGQPQNDWSESAQDSTQHHSYRTGVVGEQQSDVAGPHTTYSPGWSSYSAQGGLTQAEGVLDMRNANHADGLGSRSSLGAVLLTRPDSSQFRPTSSGSFTPHQ
ncbi:unnamed protein product [Sympodiomycopsis kandeliae]